nr:magnesium transporter [Roseovarius sp.]
MTDNNILTAPPEAPGPEQKPVREQVKDAVDARDAETLVALLDPLARSAALRHLLLLVAEDRDILLTLIPVELAGALIEEAPVQAATDLVERLSTDRAADVLDKLNSNLQADIIGNLGAETANAILARLHPDDAADVRRLAEYDDGTAGGLMAAEAFKFPETATVGAVLRGMVSDDD